MFDIKDDVSLSFPFDHCVSCRRQRAGGGYLELVYVQSDDWRRKRREETGSTSLGSHARSAAAAS